MNFGFMCSTKVTKSLERSRRTMRCTCLSHFKRPFIHLL